MDPRCFELLNTDTDSIYVALSRKDIRSCVPEKNLMKFDQLAAKVLVNPEDPKSRRQPG